MKASRYVVSMTTIIAIVVLIITGVVKFSHVHAKSVREFDSRVESTLDIAPVEGPQDPCSPGTP